MLNNRLNIKSKFNLITSNNNNNQNKSKNFNNSKLSHFSSYFQSIQSGSEDIQVDKNSKYKKACLKMATGKKFEIGKMFLTPMKFEKFSPLSFKNIYTNSEWINKQVNQFNEWSNPNGCKRASYRQLIKIPQTLHSMSNQSFNNANVKRFFTLKPKQTSQIMDDDIEKKSFDSLLIHRSITFYGNQMRNPRRIIYNTFNSSKNFISGFLTTETNQSITAKSNSQISQDKIWTVSSLDDENSKSNNVIVTPFEVLVQGYLWHKLISQSSTSSLYEASRLFVSRGHVACKHVKLSTIGISTDFYDNILRNIVVQNHMIIEEMRILRQVRHKFIVPVYDIIHSGIDYYIMMKLAVNKTICRKYFVN